MADKTILIVDDDDIIIRMLSNILSKEYNIVSASSGEAAIEMFDQVKPDIIISDYMMPKMNGFEMMDKLRSKYGDNTYAIFMTANEQEETVFEVFRHGAIDFIRKPFKAQELQEVIRCAFAKLDEMEDK